MMMLNIMGPMWIKSQMPFLPAMQGSFGTRAGEEQGGVSLTCLSFLRDFQKAWLLGKGEEGRITSSELGQMTREGLLQDGALCSILMLCPPRGTIQKLVSRW